MAIRRKKEVDGDLHIPGSITVLGGINTSAVSRVVTRVSTTEQSVTTIQGEVATIEGQIQTIEPFIENRPPTANITDLSFSSEATNNGSVIVNASFDYTQGTDEASGFMLFIKRSATPDPAAINVSTDPCLFIPYTEDGSYSVKVELATRQMDSGNTLPIYYRFGCISCAFRSAKTAFHTSGVVELAGWVSKTFAGIIAANDINFWDLDSGEMRVGSATSFIHVTPDTGAMELSGLELKLTGSDLSTTDPSGNRLTHEFAQHTWRDAEGKDKGFIGMPQGSDKIIIDRTHAVVLKNALSSTFTGLSNYARYTSQIYNGKLYLPQYGGTNMDIYDIATGTKTTFTGLSNHSRFASQIYNGKLYLPQYDGTNMDIYDIATGTKTTFTGLSNLHHIASQIYNGKLYLPQDGGTNMDVYDIATGTKTTFTGLSNHNRFASQIYNGKLYLPQYGGTNMDIYDIATGTKTTFTGLSNHNRFASQIYNGKLYLPQYGGTNMDIYDIATGTKTTFTGLSNHSRYTSQVYNGKLYLPQYDGTNMDIYDIATGTKTTFTGLSNHGRYTSQVYNGKLYLPQTNGTNMDIFTIAELCELGAGIIESGSNANGSYVKYSDGTMEQWGATAINCTIIQNTAIGTYGWSYYYGTTALPFPKQFHSVDSLLVSNNNGIGARYSSVTTSGFTAFAINDAPVNPAYVSWLAKGRWKV